MSKRLHTIPFQTGTFPHNIQMPQFKSSYKAVLKTSLMKWLINLHKKTHKEHKGELHYN